MEKEARKEGKGEGLKAIILSVIIFFVFIGLLVGVVGGCESAIPFDRSDLGRGYHLAESVNNNLAEIAGSLGRIESKMDKVIAS